MNKAIKEFKAELKKIEKKQGKLFTAKLKKKEKKEKALFNRFDRFRTRKCSTYFKEQTAESERFRKEQDIQCPQTNNNAFYDCSVGFYDGPEGSKLRKLSEKIKNLSELKAHVFGHIHEAQGIVEKDGVTYVNASILDLYYEVKNSPVILHT
jgi:hypothetical protein